MIASTGRRHRERGSTLLLFPVAILVVTLLSAIAVDLSNVHLARRELLRMVQQSADDAAMMRSRNQPDEVDLASASALVRARLRIAPARTSITSVRVERGPRPQSVRVTATATVTYVFGVVSPDRRSTDIEVEAIGEQVMS